MKHCDEWTTLTASSTVAFRRSHPPVALSATVGTVRAFTTISPNMTNQIMIWTYGTIDQEVPVSRDRAMQQLFGEIVFPCCEMFNQNSDIRKNTFYA